MLDGTNAKFLGRYHYVWSTTTYLTDFEPYLHWQRAAYQLVVHPNLDIIAYDWRRQSGMANDFMASMARVKPRKEDEQELL